MKFKLVAEVTISVSTIVEADTLEKAIEIAEERSNMDIPINNGYPEDEYWVTDELDGSVQNIHVDE
jgi:hypothetical protein